MFNTYLCCLSSWNDDGRKRNEQKIRNDILSFAPDSRLTYSYSTNIQRQALYMLLMS